MELSGYADRLRTELVSAASTGSEVADATLQRLTSAFDAAIRMTLLEALADAAAEISAELPDGAVELRLKGRDPEFVVTSSPPSPDDGGESPASDAEPSDEQATARLTLRLPEPLKQRVDDAAGRARLSTNTWLVEVVRTAVAAPDVRRRGRGRHLSGWAH